MPSSLNRTDGGKADIFPEYMAYSCWLLNWDTSLEVNSCNVLPAPRRQYLLVDEEGAAGLLFSSERYAYIPRPGLDSLIGQAAELSSQSFRTCSNDMALRIVT